MLVIAAAITGPLVLGAGFLAWIAPGAPRTPLARIGWSYLVGILVLGVATGAWILSGVGPSRAAALVLPFAIGAICAVLARFRGPARRPASDPPSGRRESAAFAIVLIVVLAVLADRAVVFDLVPVVSGDEALIFGSRAKVMHARWRGAAQPIGETPGAPLLHHADYPPLNSLLQAWTFAASGRLVDVVQRVPFQAAFLALVFVSAAGVRRTLRPAAAAVLVLLWLPGEVFAPMWLAATSDMFVAAGFLLAVEAWRAFAARGDTGSWRIFACALGLLAWSKHEGAMLMVCLGAGCAVAAVIDPATRRALARLRRELLWLFLPLALFTATWTSNAVAGRENDLVADNPGRIAIWERVLLQAGDRGGAVVAWVAQHVVLDPAASRFLWIAFLAVVLLQPRFAFGGSEIATTTALLLGLAGYVLVFVGSYHDVAWHLETAGQRVCFHLWPALLAFSARAAAALFPKLGNPAEKLHGAIA